MKYCIYCGYKMPKTAKFCPKCGRKQDRSNTTTHIQPQVNTRPSNNIDIRKKRGTAALVWGWILIVLSVVIPIIGSVISFICSIDLITYPERKVSGYILMAVSIVVTILLFNYALGFYPAFINSFLGA